MFQRLTREEVDFYLDNRVAQGFTVIQSVAYWFPHGPFRPYGPLNESNAYGHRPFLGDSDSPQTSDPKIVIGGDSHQPNDYWDHADYTVEAIAQRGLTLVLLALLGQCIY